MPAFYAAALTEAEIQRRFQDRGRTAPKGDHVLACWPLAEEKGDRVADAGRHGRHGRIINHATWMIGGPGFQAARDPYVEYDPAKDTDRGHGLRLASDDLFDCGWKPTHEYQLPENAKSGIYVGRIRFEHKVEKRLHQTVFIVKKAARRADNHERLAGTSSPECHR